MNPNKARYFRKERYFITNTLRENFKREMKGRRGMKKKGGISSIESNPCMSLASCEHTDEQGSRGRKEGVDCGWRTRWLMSISYVQEGGGARDCSPRLKSREPLLNGELARISRTWIYSPCQDAIFIEL